MTFPQQGQLRIIAKYHWLAFTLALFKPIATINGQQVRLNWGENLIPAPVGTHQISIHIPYLWNFGQATIVVDNTAGVPTIHYGAPMWNFGGGAIGYEPQKHPGMVGVIAVYSVLALFIVCCCGGSIISSIMDSGTY